MFSNKQVEVFMVQLLDLCVAVPVASYDLENTGEFKDVHDRVQKVLRYASFCDNCLKKSIESGQPLTCESFCHECFELRAVCDRHLNIFDCWVRDKRPCLHCAMFKLKYNRMKMLVSVSDIDPSYEKYGKSICATFDEFLQGRKHVPYHLPDIGHNIKNAEASLERGTHFDAEFSYDGTDLTVLLSSLDEEDYQLVNAGLSHRAVLQFDKQSDELSLQRISSNVTEALSKAKAILKTDVPEQRRPWFTEDHDKIDKPLFVAISKCGLVFATDDHRQNVFYHRQSGLPRKVTYIGKQLENDGTIDDSLLTIDDSLLTTAVDSSRITCKAVSGITFFRGNQAVLVADFGLKTIRVLQCSKAARTKENKEITKYLPITILRRLPNSKILIQSFKVQNMLDMVAFGLCETPNDLLIVTDPTSRSVIIVDVAKDLKSAICLSTISLFPQSALKLFDCTAVSGDLVAVTDLSTEKHEKNQLHIISTTSKEVVHTLTDDISPAGLCMMKETLILSDTKSHAIYSYYWLRKDLKLLVGEVGAPGFDDGPVSKCRLTSPVGLSCRGTTLYVAEHPDNWQEGIRVFSNLDGIVKFKES